MSFEVPCQEKYDEGCPFYLSIQRKKERKKKLIKLII